MQPIFILIRGNSGSGKTVLAEALQKYFGYEKCLLLHQDMLRRDLLHTHDHTGTLAINLIENLVQFGTKHYQIIILEGILRENVYGDMLQRVIHNFGKAAFVYYLNVPFTTTVKQNQLKDSPFTVSDLKKWWLIDDQLKSSQEHQLTEGHTSDLCQQIIADIKNHKKGY